MKSIIFLALVALPLAASAAGAKPGALDPAVADLCARDAVLLGEDGNHGSGRAVELKAELVRRLVGECKFDAVFFESPVYDFAGFRDALADGTATREQLADAIGGMWSVAKEIDPLVTFLFDAAKARRVTLAGLDPQAGGATGLYAQRKLPERLAAVLDEPRRAECAAEIGRLTQGEYDDAHPDDAAAHERLRACAAEIEAKATDETAALARNFSRFLAMSAGDAFNVRDNAMYENFVRERARLPEGSKVIVWTANVHALRAPPPHARKNKPFGSFVAAELGKRSAAVAFSACAGSVGRTTPATPLPPPEAESLEAQICATNADVRYLDNHGLRRFGWVTGRAIDYTAPVPIDWSSLLDGLVVVRTEHPLTIVRPAKPQQRVK